MGKLNSSSISSKSTSGGMGVSGVDVPGVAGVSLKLGLPRLAADVDGMFRSSISFSFGATGLISVTRFVLGSM